MKIRTVTLKSMDAFCNKWKESNYMSVVKTCSNGYYQHPTLPIREEKSTATMCDSMGNFIYELDKDMSERDLRNAIQLRGIPVSNIREKWTPEIIEYLMTEECRGKREPAQEKNMNVKEVEE